MKRDTCFLKLVTLVILVSGVLSMTTTGADLTLQAGLASYPDPQFDSLVRIEFPFTVNRSDFEFYQPDSAISEYYARIFAEVKIMDGRGVAIDSSKTYFSALVTNQNDAYITGLKLFDKLAVNLSPGLYTARLTVIDAVSKNSGEAFYDSVFVTRPDPDRLAIGGTSLAYSITADFDSARVNQKMIQNGLLVYTNPLGIYSTTDTTLYLYSELYNLAADAIDSGSVKIEYRIENEYGRVARDYGYRLQERTREALVVSEALDIRSLLAGRYQLRMMVSDTARDQSALIRIPFMVLAAETFEAAAIASRNLTDPYDTLDVEARISVSRYLLDPEERSMLDGLTVEGKLNFLDQFWKEHDEEPLTPRIENRERAVERFYYCNQYFSTNITKTNGWSSDRGRIFMTYGEAGRIVERLMPSMGSPEGSTVRFTNPYVVWFYDQIEEGKVVVFEDKTGGDDYVLVHSTFDGELYSVEWYTILRTDFLEYDR